MPPVSSLIKKTDYNTKITEIKNKLNNHNHDKYITTPVFNTLASDVFNARLAANTLHISSWKSKGISAETIKPPCTSDNSLTPLIDYVGNEIRLKFSGSCFKTT